MTPRETLAAIEARVWRIRQDRQGLLFLAWHVAAMSRAKRIPPLQRLIGTPDAQELDEESLEERREEFKRMTAAWRHN